MSEFRIAIPEPTTIDLAYTERSWPQYAEAVERFGGTAVRIPATAAPDVQARLLNDCSGILLPGSPADVDPQKYGSERDPKCGQADPARESTDELLLQDAFNLHKPILAICYGLQSLNVWKGGSLIQDIDSPVNHRPGRDVRQAHMISLSQRGLLKTLVQSATPEPAAAACWTNSSHHQAVRTVGDGLQACGWSEEDKIVEAVEGAEGEFVLGVQWHPERTVDLDPVSQAIFRGFVDAVQAWRPKAISESTLV